MDKLFVRLTIFGISLFFLVTIFFAFNGIKLADDIYKIALEYCFYLLVKTQGKYHCRWARALALNIFITESFTYLDSIFNIIPDARVFLIVLSCTWVIAVSLTIYRGIKHYKRARKIKDKND